MTVRQLFVSSSTKNASGFTPSMIGSILTSIFPMASTAVPVAALRK